MRVVVMRRHSGWAMAITITIAIAITITITITTYLEHEVVFRLNQLSDEQRRDHSPLDVAPLGLGVVLVLIAVVVIVVVLVAAECADEVAIQLGEVAHARSRSPRVKRITIP